MYGIYDLNGGTQERTAGYIANGNSSLKTYGTSLTYEGNRMKTTSTKYTTVYPHNEENTDIDTASKNNYLANTKIFGDGIRETSTSGIGSSGWNGDYSCFPALYGPFAYRGGGFWISANAGLFAFGRTNGDSSHNYGFRPVVVCI